MTDSSIRVFSLNIERDKHIELILHFLREFRPNVICLQELLEPDFGLFKDSLEMEGFFSPMVKKPIIQRSKEILVTQGIGLFTNLPIIQSKQICYLGHTGQLLRLNENDMTTVNWMLLYVTVVKNGQKFTLGTTHFIWSPDGKPSKLQRKGVESLLNHLKDIPEIVFCGDFNTPRGGKIWDSIAECYKDNIPAEYQSSIDSEFHRFGDLQILVDVLFSTPDCYCFKNVRLISGLSDHCAVVAEIHRS